MKDLLTYRRSVNNASVHVFIGRSIRLDRDVGGAGGGDKLAQLQVILCISHQTLNCGSTQVTSCFVG